MSDYDDDRDTCVHEAAHTVLGWHSDAVIVTGVTVDEHPQCWTTSTNHVHRTGEYARFVMAGELAAWRDAGEDGPPQAYFYDALTAGVAALDEYADDTGIDPRADEQDVLAAVDALAVVAGVAPQSMLDVVRRDTVRLLDEHAVDVEAVAQALAERRTLTGDELTALIGEQRMPWWHREVSP